MKYDESFSPKDLEFPKKETVFDKTGSPVISAKEKVFAKVIQATDPHSGSTQSKYYIRTHDSMPYDPNGMHSHRDRWLNTSLKNVKKETFDFYMLFLKTRNSLYMTRTQRSFIND